ncbi:MAG TPA: SCO family protein [Gammaproteobacteria bacterium]|nr:SCO family protein [Gammaproteobacteria bacterium]
MRKAISAGAGRLSVSVAALLGLVAVLALGGCGRRSGAYELTNISGIMAPLQFTLTDSRTGKQVHADHFKGRIVLLYFGYTHCPDVCPTTLARLTHAVKSLGAKADQVRILFVTVDPKRDSLAVLKRYAAGFGPQVVGLRGSQTALKALTKRYRATYGYGKPDADGNYTVSHSAAVYIFDRDGEARLLGKPTNNGGAYVHDLKMLVDEG